MTTENKRERMSRIAPETMTEDQRKAAEELASGPRGEVRGPFNVMLRSPGLMSPLQKVGEYLRFRCELDRRIAEMATLIAARHWTQVYEWSAHHPLALKAGQVYVNSYFSPSMHETPVAGQKQSGVGEAGLTKYLQSKAVFLKVGAA